MGSACCKRSDGAEKKRGKVADTKRSNDKAAPQKSNAGRLEQDEVAVDASISLSSESSMGRISQGGPNELSIGRISQGGLSPPPYMLQGERKIPTVTKIPTNRLSRFLRQLFTRICACCKRSDGEEKKGDNVGGRKRSKEPKVEAKMKKTEATDTKQSNAQAAPERSNDGRQGLDEESSRSRSWRGGGLSPPANFCLSFREDGKTPIMTYPEARALEKAERAKRRKEKKETENKKNEQVPEAKQITASMGNEVAQLPYVLEEDDLDEPPKVDLPSPFSSFRDDGKIPSTICPLSRALTKFALDMYTKINSGNRNIVFSPLSIALALALTETGASGKTRSEIHTLIGPGDKTQECGQLYGALQEEIFKIPKTYGEFRIVNAFFGDIGKVKNTFLKNVKKCLKTEIRQVPFKKDTEKARQRINHWVSDKTTGKIPQLYSKDGLKPESVLVLVNAVYLKMNWQTPFSLGTTEKIFYCFGRPYDCFGLPYEHKIRFMCRFEKGIQYADRKTLQIVELPYKGSAMSMYIVLPRSREGITDVEKDLTVDRLINLFKSTDSCKVNLEMPRFAMRFQMPLLPKFRQMGFHTFDELKQVTDVPVAISDAVHEAYIKVDEKGTKAVTATGVFGPQDVMAEVEPTYDFIANHPFLFFIVHKPTWSIVFMGKVNYVDCK